ncbi:hypothetical protein MAR_014976, partial [Mya arenaria]
MSDTACDCVRQSFREDKAGYVTLEVCVLFRYVYSQGMCTLEVCVLWRYVYSGVICTLQITKCIGKMIKAREYRVKPK